MTFDIEIFDINYNGCINNNCDGKWRKLLQGSVADKQWLYRRPKAYLEAEQILIKFYFWSHPLVNSSGNWPRSDKFKFNKPSIINVLVLINIYYAFKVDFLTISYARDQLGKFQIRPQGYNYMQIQYQMMKGSYKVML